MNIIRLVPKVDERLLYNYLLKVDKDFGIPLSEKVRLDLYAIRLLANGNVLAVDEDGELVSVIAFYSNDDRYRIAHLPLLSTIEKARGKGYARLLISEMVKVCQQAGMLKICCNSVNPVAISLYKSMGFVVVSKEQDKGFEKYFLEYKII